MKSAVSTLSPICCEKAYTLSPEAYKAMVRGIIKKEALRH